MGDILFTQHILDSGELEVTATWRGGQFMHISGTAMKEIFDPKNYFTNGKNKKGIRCRKAGNYLNVGEYKLRVIAYNKTEDCYTVKRIK